MHIPLTFQLVIKRLFLFQTFSILRSIPTYKPQHILLKNNNSHHSITYPSYFYNRFTQLFHHYSHTTNSISFFRPQLLISASFHPQHASTLSSLPHLLQTTHNQPLSQLFTTFSSLSTVTMSKPAPQIAHQVPRHTASYACTLHDAGLHHPFCGRQVLPTPTFGLVGGHNN